MLPYIFDSQRGEDSHHSIVLCISPLVALTRDQKAKFSPRGLRTEYVGDDDKSAYEAVKAGDCQLVYMTPESLFSNPDWWEMLRSPVYQSSLVAVVIDEVTVCKSGTFKIYHMSVERLYIAKS